MKKGFFLVSLGSLSLNLLFSDTTQTTNYPDHEISIVGGGIIGALESYYAHLEALKTGKKLRLTVYEKGQSFEKPALSSPSNSSTNTSFNIVPSLTIDEILAVVPRGSELFEKLAILFSEPGGIRVDDVAGVNESEAATSFKEAVEIYGQDQNHEDRTKTLLMLGKMSMDLWQKIYDHADEELKTIMIESNYNPCHNPKNAEKMVLHDGYRIDLIYDVPNAKNRAQNMQSTYEQLGYTNCKILSPSEVMVIDPSLSAFCQEHSTPNSSGELEWNEDSAGLWRPGGCLDTHIFLPKLYAYIKKAMGTYISKSGKEKDCFHLKFNKEVTAVEHHENRIKGLKFRDGSVKYNKNAEYIFCPGESVGTLHNLGFKEPAYAGFAGSSLLLNIPLSNEELATYKSFSHCMEIHKVGIILSWQARIKEDKLFIGVGGTKAFYGDQLPSKDEAFAKNRNLVQLNMINDVLPEMISIACGYRTKGKKLTSEDMNALEDKGILSRWVGRRAVAYDGFPTLGALYYGETKIINARCTTHLGSGGVSFGPAAIQVSRSLDETAENEFIEKVLKYADSRRNPKNM